MFIVIRVLEERQILTVINSSIPKCFTYSDNSLTKKKVRDEKRLP